MYVIMITNLTFSTATTSRTLSDPFPPMSANPVARKHFAKRCVELIENYNFDGIE